MSSKCQDQKNRIKPYFSLDSYYSFIGSKSADVFGFKAGIEWDDTWRFAAGYNKITSDIIEYKQLPGQERSYAGRDSVKAQLYLRYYPVMAEYVFHNHDPWQLSVPLSIGYGRSYFQYYDTREEARRIFEHGVLVSDIGLSAQYKILKWIGLGAGLGYRLMLVNNPKIDTRFNSPIFSLKLKLFPSEIYKSLFPEKDKDSDRPG